MDKLKAMEDQLDRIDPRTDPLRYRALELRIKKEKEARGEKDH